MQATRKRCRYDSAIESHDLSRQSRKQSLGKSGFPSSLKSAITSAFRGKSCVVKRESTQVKKGGRVARIAREFEADEPLPYVNKQSKRQRPDLDFKQLAKEAKLTGLCGSVWKDLDVVSVLNEAFGNADKVKSVIKSIKKMSSADSSLQSKGECAISMITLIEYVLGQTIHGYLSRTPIKSTTTKSGYVGVYPGRNGRWQAQVTLI